MPHPRLLIVDESLNPRLASALKRRGRAAISLQELRLRRIRDEPLLLQLAQSHPNGVLVTADDAMPAEHGDTLAQLGSTVATIDPAHPAGYQQETWQWEVIQRWAHRMQRQPAGSIRRYSATRSAPWRARVRKQRS